MKKIFLLFFFIFLLTFVSGKNNEVPIPIAFDNIKVSGELSIRALKNFDRLETEIYYPENVFPEKHEITSLGWPGDKEGRTILALTLLAQSTHREPLYLKKMIEMIPEKINEKGYLGPLQRDTINEQQLSGHGWFLRGLCEYYLWKKDPIIKNYILNIIQNLALPTIGFHKDYPINPEYRKVNVGGMAGTTQNVVNNWLLSSDIGCDFIFLDGIVQAYTLFPSKELVILIQEMINRFLEMDLVKIKAQTHASLTAMRALLRYYAINNDVKLLKEVEKRYHLYREVAMTENYENFNWFDRPEWTEPCAIIDSYMVATQLWQFTSNPKYLEDAQQIYYNAICHTQRANGGFGCDNCTHSDDKSLKIKEYEAYWCCTMRGGEGLSRAIQYSYFTIGEKIYLPFFHSSESKFYINGTKLFIHQITNYPFDSKINLELYSENPTEIILSLFAPSWLKNLKININGESIKFTKEKGFINFPVKVSKTTKIEYSFDMVSKFNKSINRKYTKKNNFTLRYGPLILGYQGNEEISFKDIPSVTIENNQLWKIHDSINTYNFTPIYHLLSENVKGESYKRQIIFNIQNGK
jgi:hypothetical protein